MRGDRLKQLREQLGLSQRQLALHLGLGEKQIWRYENDTHSPSSEHLILISKLLHVSTDYLLGQTDDPLSSLSEDDLSPDERKLLAAFRAGRLDDLLQVVTDARRHHQSDDPTVPSVKKP